MGDELIIQKANDLRKRFDAFDKYDGETVAEIWVRFSQKFYGETWAIPDYSRVSSSIVYYEKVVVPKKRKTENENKKRTI